ncbi:hypothetical protein ACFX13_012442 [Malus domestica]
MGRFFGTVTTFLEGTRRTLIQIGIKRGHYNVFLGKCFHMVRKWLGNHLYFSKATTCIRSLVFSHSFVNQAIVGILIVYLTESWNTEQFEMAAIVTNLQEGITSVMVIVLAHISNSYMSRFKMIVSTNAAYILVPSKFMRAQTSAKAYYGVAVLVVLGEAGRSTTLPEFLDDQYFDEQKQTPLSDENRRDTRREALWSHPWILGAFLSMFLTTMSWTRTFWVSATLVGASYLVFLLGYSCYFVRSRIDESAGESRLVEQQRKKYWPLKKIKGEKSFFIEAIAMRSVFLAYTMVEATGSTFFFEQMSYLDHKVGTVKPLYFKLIGSFSCFLVSFLCDELLDRKQYWQNATLARIGSGLLAMTHLRLLYEHHVASSAILSLGTNERAGHVRTD